jgi:hypothetical protein
MAASIENPGLLWQWGVGILVVLLYARDRFDSPGSVRWTTTFAQYWFARTGYMAVLLLGYLILGGAFTDAKPLLDFFLGKDSSIRSSEYLPGPLFAALLLTSFLPHIPQLKQLDEAAKQLFQRIGNIPSEVRMFSAQLERARLIPGAHIRENEYIELGVKPEWLQLPESRLTYWWARIGLMHAAVNAWDGDPRYVNYVTERKSSRDDIDRRVEQFLALHGVGPNGITADELAPGAPDYRTVSREIEEIHRSLCDFIAGGLLHAARGPRQRQNSLNELGFEGSEKELRPAMSVHQVFLIGGIIFLMVLFAALVFEQFVNPGDLRLEIRVLFMIPVLYCTSIMIAIYSKSAWSFANIREVGSRPVAGYFAAGAVAVAAAFMIQLLFRFAQGGNVLQVLSEPGKFKEAFTTNIDRWPWYLMTLFTTVAIAWAADNYYSSDKEPVWLRAAETVGMAVFFAGIQWVTLQLLLEYSHDPGRWLGKEWRMIVTSTLVGACIGFFVPHFYRTSFTQPEAVSAHPLSVLRQAA